MKAELENILDVCIARLQAGEPLASVLADSPPELREALQPLLVLAADLNQLEEPHSSPAVVQAGEQHMLSHVQPANPAPGFLSNLIMNIERQINQIKTIFSKENNMFRKPVVVIAIIVALIVGGGAVTAVAAQSALPGDFIYPVKTTLEDVRIRTAFDSGSEARLSIQYTGERLEEISRLMAADREDDLALGLEECEKYLGLALESLNTVARNDPERAAELASQLSDLLAEQALIFAALGEGSAADIQDALEAAQDSAQDALGNANTNDNDDSNANVDDNSNTNDDDDSNTNDDDDSNTNDDDDSNANDNDDSNTNDDDDSNTNDNDDSNTNDDDDTNTNDDDDSNTNDDDNSNTNDDDDNNTNDDDDSNTNDDDDDDD